MNNEIRKLTKRDARWLIPALVIPIVLQIYIIGENPFSFWLMLFFTIYNILRGRAKLWYHLSLLILGLWNWCDGMGFLYS